MNYYGDSPVQKSQRASMPVDPSLRGLAHRIERSKVKVATIINRCEAIDRNRDGIVHAADLEDVLIDLLGPEGITKRELSHVSRYLQAPGYDDGSIEYRKLHSVLEFHTEKESERPSGRAVASKEHWYDPADILDRRAMLKRGSVGEWLQNGSCPAEISNFRRFIKMLEDYERETGLKCVPTEKGFTVPMGPDLKASISFTLTP